MFMHERSKKIQKMQKGFKMEDWSVLLGREFCKFVTKNKELSIDKWCFIH